MQFFFSLRFSSHLLDMIYKPKWCAYLFHQLLKESIRKKNWRLECIRKIFAVLVYVFLFP